MAHVPCYIYFDGCQIRIQNKVNNVKEFIESLKAENAALNKKAAALRAENKADEAVFATVRANVYDICATVCGVKMKTGDIEGFGAMLDRFEGEWGASLQAAEKQDNAKKICVEQTKLEALADVRARFAAARGE